jgi:molybdopterin-guanine dinucleotide biosynthesis protein A
VTDFEIRSYGIIEKGRSVVVGGIVLAGGQSRRMRRDKASLPFGQETMLGRVLRLLGQAVEPLVVVAAPSQNLPPMPSGVAVVRDRAEGKGPLEGLYCGLRFLQSQADAAFATACDAPLLRPEFVSQAISLLSDHDVVVPLEDGFFHPLAAVYRTRIVETIGDLLTLEQLRMRSFYERVSTRSVDVSVFRSVDPQLHSLVNINHPDDYQRALRLAGLDT